MQLAHSAGCVRPAARLRAVQQVRPQPCMHAAVTRPVSRCRQQRLAVRATGQGASASGDPAAAASTTALDPVTPYAQVPVQPVRGEDGSPTPLPNAAGVYAMFDGSGALQYIGLSRKVATSVATHAQELPELAQGVKVGLLADASKDSLTAAWKSWIEAAVAETGAIPPGNAPGASQWPARRARPPKPEIRLTPGKGLADLTCSVEDLIDQVVKNNRVVAFVKGTRTAPQCGFSHRVLTQLTEARAEFEVVNVLDEVYNPGLRDAIKAYSQWPTIPQVYVDGEFVGGADILDEMTRSGELQQLLAAKK